MADYVAALCAVGEHCEFGDSLNEMIRDRLVCGINNPRVQTWLLQEPGTLTYQKALETAQTMELASRNVQDLSKQPQYSVHHTKENHKGSIKPVPPKSVECYRCGANHYATQCRFQGAECQKCGKKGHLAKVCRRDSHKKQDQSRQQKTKHTKPANEAFNKYNAHSIDYGANPQH